jgi:hypothetical protein
MAGRDKRNRAKIATNFTKQEKSKKFAQKKNIQRKKDGKLVFVFQ